MRKPNTTERILLTPLAAIAMLAGATVYWFAWLCIQVLLVVTGPLCWLGKNLVEGRIAIRRTFKRLADWLDGEPAPRMSADIWCE